MVVCKIVLHTKTDYHNREVAVFSNIPLTSKPSRLEVQVGPTFISNRGGLVSFTRTQNIQILGEFKSWLHARSPSAVYAFNRQRNNIISRVISSGIEVDT